MTVVKDLFLNVCIYVTVLFLASQLFRNTGLDKVASAKLQVISGALSGTFGIILMIFSVQVTPNIILDFRELAIIVGAVYSGWKSVLITGTVMAVFRVFYLGVSSYSMLKAISILLMCFGCIAISRCKISKKNKWIYMFVFTGIIYSTFVSVLVKDRALLESTLLYFWFGFAISNFIVYMLSEYLIKINWTIERLQKEATKDYLTGLNNVRCFDSSFNELLKRAKENDESVGLLIIDIDFFKKVNDTYGHAAGDSVLKQLSETLASSIRDFDVVARIGGEEFGVILRDCSAKRSSEIAERIRRRVESQDFVLSCGTHIKITLSIGVAVYPATVADINMLKEKADEKLYEAKHSGRNRVCL